MSESFSVKSIDRARDQYYGTVNIAYAIILHFLILFRASVPKKSDFPFRSFVGFVGADFTVDPISLGKHSRDGILRREKRGLGEGNGLETAGS